MTIITRENPTDLVLRPIHPVRSRTDARRRPHDRRPAGAALPHRGTGLLMSRASHRRRPLTPTSTVVLALVAAAITVWLGLVAEVGGAPAPAETSSAVPTRLAVVQVQTGETLQQLARRIAPDAPAGAVADRIRDLNQLDSSAVDAGQTLIAPVG